MSRSPGTRVLHDASKNFELYLCSVEVFGIGSIFIDLHTWFFFILLHVVFAALISYCDLTTKKGDAEKWAVKIKRIQYFSILRNIFHLVQPLPRGATGSWESGKWTKTWIKATSDYRVNGPKPGSKQTDRALGRTFCNDCGESKTP